MGLNVYESYQNTVNNNTVNGNKLFTWNMSRYHCRNNAGQVIILNCSNITVQNQHISEVGGFGIDCGILKTVLFQIILLMA